MYLKIYLILSFLLFFDFSLCLTQREALEDIYNGMNGKNWENNNNWLNSSIDYCEWYGVFCDSNQDVIKIELDNNNLNQSIPDSISSLIYLTNISLSGNSIR